MYELKGCQKAVDLLTEYYGIRRMRIVVDGRKVGNGDEACYDRNVAYFTKRGVKKSNILHEFYHHLVDARGLDLPRRLEEKHANRYVREFLRSPYF